jgi:septal ring factor EnvC (AmiA/AmiB activator)
MAPALLINSDFTTPVSAERSSHISSLILNTSAGLARRDEHAARLQTEVNLLRTSLSETTAEIRSTVAALVSENRRTIAALEIRLSEMNREITSLQRQFR